jgi:hypothetical protein
MVMLKLHRRNLGFIDVRSTGAFDRILFLKDFHGASAFDRILFLIDFHGEGGCVMTLPDFIGILREVLFGTAA